MRPEQCGIMLLWFMAILLIVWGVRMIKNPSRVHKSNFLKYLVQIPLRKAPLTENLIRSQGFSWILGGIILILIGVWYLWG